MAVSSTIPRINAADLLDPTAANHAVACEQAVIRATQIGVLTVHNTPLQVHEVMEQYKLFFRLQIDYKTQFDMARTGSNRGWGAPSSEQVDPDANPDYKEVFDCGMEGSSDEWTSLPAYAPNVWPDRPEGFKETIQAYHRDATNFALDLLCAIMHAVGEDGSYFRDKFTHPMTLLRGNYYPERPNWATERDFGIAVHTDYGCLTLLATDGSPGLEVRKRDGDWIPVSAPPCDFVVNFGEMLEMWTAGRIRATPHRVIGTNSERISVPLFLNPNHDTNVAPKGRDPIAAVDHLQKRFDETYLHLKGAEKSK